MISAWILDEHIRNAPPSRAAVGTEFVEQGEFAIEFVVEYHVNTKKKRRRGCHPADAKERHRWRSMKIVPHISSVGDDTPGRQKDQAPSLTKHAAKAGRG